MNLAKVCFLLFVTTLVLLFARQAVAQGTTRALIGKWKLDGEKTIAATEKDGRKDSSVVELVKTGGFKYQLEFSADGKVGFEFSIGGPTERKQGTWKVLDEKAAKKLMIEITVKDDGVDEAQKVEVSFPDPFTARLFLENDKQLIVLSRLVEKK